MLSRVVAVAALLAVAGCGAADDASRKPHTDLTMSARPAFTPDEKNLRAFAEESGARFSSGDYGGYWDAWSAADQKQTPRDVWIAYAEKCKPGGLPLKIEAARVEPDGKTGIVRYGVEGVVNKSVTFFAEGDGWRQDTSDETHQRVASGAC